jgi:DNA-binding LytR/AlgR family response regulator
MPKLRAFDFLRTLDRPPLVIVTSAYQEYALEGFELNVCDYLLKPFSFERFLKAVNKAVDLSAALDSKLPVSSDKTGRRIFIKGDKKHHQISLDDVVYIEAAGNYSKIILIGGEIRTPQKISEMEAILAGDDFLRVHKSFIVSTSKIKEIEGNQIRLGKFTVPIGRAYKLNLKKFLPD